MKTPTPFVHDFEGEPLVTFAWHGRPCWIARHIGVRLDYGHEGKRLPDKIRTDWADEFLPGHDFAVVSGEDLAAFNASIAKANLEGIVSRGPLCLLFEAGLHLVVAKTDLPIGKRLRRFVVDHVMPELARNGGSAPEAEANPAHQEEIERFLRLFPELRPRQSRSFLDRREARLADQARTHTEWVGLCDRRLQVVTLHRMVDAVGDWLDADTQAALEVLAAEIATGLPLMDLLEDEPEPPPDSPVSAAATADATRRAA